MSEHVDSEQPGPSNEALMKTDWNSAFCGRKSHLKSCGAQLNQSALMLVLVKDTLPFH